MDTSLKLDVTWGVFPNYTQTIYIECLDQGKWNLILEGDKIPDYQGIKRVKKKLRGNEEAMGVSNIS